MSAIYALADPATEEIRYVGKTIGKPEKRRYEHVRNAARGVARHRRLASWLRSLQAEPLLVVLETDPPGGLDEAERAWIATLLRYGCRLANMTPGGDGQSPGYVPSAEARAKTSAALKGRKPTSAQLAWSREGQRGHETSAETRKKIAAKARGRIPHNKRIWTPELRERALALYEVMSGTEAARVLGVGHRQFYAFVRQEGVTHRRSWRSGKSTSELDGQTT